MALEMSYTIPDKEPAQLRAGETLQFTIHLADYPASDGWSIIYSARGGGGNAGQFSAINFSSTADGDAHAVDVPFIETQGWIPGTYFAVGVITNGTVKRQVRAWTFDVLPDLENSAETFDARTPERRTLDNIIAVIEGRASSTILNSFVEGTRLDRIPYDQLRLLRSDYEAKVAAQEAKISGRNKRNIFIQFK